MVARVFHGFGSGVCESLPVQLVNDIFYLHERGKKIGYYTGTSPSYLYIKSDKLTVVVCLCLGSTGPLYAGYMLAGGYSWRLFFYVVTAFAGALLVAAFLLVEESRFHRPEPIPLTQVEQALADEKPTGQETQIEEALTVSIPPRKTFFETLKPWAPIDHEVEFFMTMIRSFAYFLVPAVLWVITGFGILALSLESFQY
jgi:hypothetical protein